MAASSSAVMKGPRVLDTRRLALAEVSICEDSGWRDLDLERVAELRALFEAGEYGATTLAIPSILTDADGRPQVSKHDGRYRLNIGKSTIAALQALQTAMQDGGTPPPSGSEPSPEGRG